MNVNKHEIIKVLRERADRLEASECEEQEHYFAYGRGDYGLHWCITFVRLESRAHDLGRIIHSPKDQDVPQPDSGKCT